MFVLERTWSLITGLQSGIRTMYAGGIRNLHWVAHLQLYSSSRGGRSIGGRYFEFDIAR